MTPASVSGKGGCRVRIRSYALRDRTRSTRRAVCWRAWRLLSQAADCYGVTDWKLAPRPTLNEHSLRTTPVGTGQIEIPHPLRLAARPADTGVETEQFATLWVEMIEMEGRYRRGGDLPFQASAPGANWALGQAEAPHCPAEVTLSRVIGMRE